MIFQIESQNRQNFINYFFNNMELEMPKLMENDQVISKK